MNSIIAQTNDTGFVAALGAIQMEASIRHAKRRKAAKAAGRKDFPLLPYECSWAFEEAFRKEYFQR